MPEVMVDLLQLTARWLEIAGGCALILGFLIATVRFLKSLPEGESAERQHAYRTSMGRAVIMGLEILVAATIIKTVTIEPTVEALGRVACVIAIRTVLGWSMVLEMTGRWPWQAPPPEDPASSDAPVSS